MLPSIILVCKPCYLGNLTRCTKIVFYTITRSSVHVSISKFPDMISRREKLLTHPWEVQRYENHRKKVANAKAAVDVKTPLSYPHVNMKPKKVQAEKERLKRIEEENVRLLQKLGDIMSTKRLHNFWIQPRPNFLNREKLFDTRPKTCKTIRQPPSQPETPELPRLRTSKRCQSCSGKPVAIVQQIPEERIPWEPARKSLNIRDIESYNIRKCLHCHKFERIFKFQYK